MHAEYKIGYLNWSDILSYLRTVRAKIKCPKLAVVTQYFCNINSRYYIAYYCVGDLTVRTKKTGQTKGRGVEACYEVQR